MYSGFRALGLGRNGLCLGQVCSGSSGSFSFQKGRAALRGAGIAATEGILEMPGWRPVFVPRHREPRRPPPAEPSRRGWAACQGPGLMRRAAVQAPGGRVWAPGDSTAGRWGFLQPFPPGSRGRTLGLGVLPRELSWAPAGLDTASEGTPARDVSWELAVTLMPLKASIRSVNGREGAH